MDGAAANSQELVDDLAAANDGTRELDVYLLDPTRDGIQQISEILAGYSDLDAIHLLSHGTAGKLQLGATWLTNDNLSAYAGELANWNAALRSGSDILIYGCDVAGSDEGRLFVESLAALTGANVAASTNHTGAQDFAGDWNLEFQIGKVESTVAFSKTLQANWHNLLGVITVNTTADVVGGNTSSIAALLGSAGADGFISLREAILATNNTAGADTIFLPTGTFTFTIGGQGEDAGSMGDLDITDSLTIIGAEAGSSTVDANGLDRVFHVQPGITTTISDVTLRGGTLPANDWGAGVLIDNGASLNLSRVVITGNSAGSGAGLYNYGTLLATDTTFSNNVASNWGGGLYNDRGNATLNGVTINGNIAGMDGAGINNTGAGAVMSLINATVSGNTATGQGGGLWTNRAVTAINATIAFNDASAGDGVYGQGGTGTISFKNSILYNPAGANANKAMTSLGYNIDSDGTAGFAGTGDVTTNPQLAILANYGGNTATHALLLGSPAINSGTATGAPATDQRGVARLGATDKGAFEYTPSVAPTITSNGGGTTGSINVAEDTTAVTTVTATDPDVPAQMLTYSIIGGADATKFSINGGTGALRFVAAPNFEAPTDIGGNNVYNVTVQVSDGNGGTDTQALSVTVTDVNDVPPIVTAGQTRSVNEDAANGFSLGSPLLATDVDTVGSLQAWAIVSGNTNGIFAINAATGQLTVVNNTNLNYESDNSYTLVIRVGDGVSTSANTNVVVNVININESPTITTIANRAILESGNTGALSFTVSDPESAAGSLTVTATSSNQTIIPNANLVFAGSAANRTIRATPVVGQSGGPVTITVTVSDGVNLSQQTFDVTVVPRVITVTTTADEDNGDTTDILTLLANPGGAGISLREAIIATNNTLIGATPDQIILPSGNYLLSLGALDKIDDDLIISGGGARTTTVDAQGLHRVFEIDGNSTVTMTDLVIQGGNSSNGGGAFVNGGATLNLTDVRLTGNTGTGQSGGAVHVHGTLNLNRVLLDNNIASDGGALGFHGADGGTLTNVTISGNTATSGNGGAIDTDVFISITNSTIANNTGATVGGIFVSGGGGVLLKNSILNNNGANASGALASGGYNIDSDGTALLGGAGDLVVDPQLNALANNGGQTNTHAPTGGGAALNPVGLAGAPAVDQRGVARDASPDIGAYEGSVGSFIGAISDGYAGAEQISENAPNGSAVGVTAIATDPDVGDAVTYSLTDNAGGRFTIHPTTGIVTVADSSLLDYETSASHNIAVRATSSDGSFSTRLFTINVAPVNDNAPQIASNGGGVTAFVNINENTTAVTTVTATDADLPTQTLFYSIIGGADQTAFTIDINTGAVSFLTPPDFELPADVGLDNIYEVLVQVSDGTLIDTQSIFITITPIDESAPVFTSGTFFAVNENTTAVTTVTATDLDRPVQTLTFSILPGIDGALFMIDAGTGILRFIAPPDFEFPTDFNANNVYEVNVQVSDGALAATQTVFVTVLAVNDNAPIATNDSYNVNAGSVLTIAIPGVLATDSDTDGDTLSAVLVSSVSNGLLTLNLDGSFTYTPNPNFNGTDSFTYRAADGSTLSNLATVIITVLPNNSIPSANDDSYSIEENGVLDVAAAGVLGNDTDIDGDPLTAALVSGPSNSVLVLNIDGSFTYTPNVNFNGIDTFTYRVSDGQGGFAVGTVQITVRPTLAPPQPPANPPPPTPPNPPSQNDSTDGQPPFTWLSPFQPTPDGDADSVGRRPIENRVSTPPNSQPQAEVVASAMITEDPSFFDSLAENSVRRLTRGAMVAGAAIEDQLLASFDVGLLWDDLTNLKDELRSSALMPYLAAGSVVGLTSSLTVGYVFWAIRSGWLVTGLLAQMPAWCLVDPLVVLDYLDEESSARGRSRQDDDDSLESLLDEDTDGMRLPLEDQEATDATQPDMTTAVR